MYICAPSRVHVNAPIQMSLIKHAHTHTQIKAMVTTQKPVRRERKHSTSSNSSGSSYTHPHRSHPHTPPRPHPVPMRASSDPTLYPSRECLSTKTTPWTSNTAESINTAFPNLPVSEQSTLPWSYHPHSITSNAPTVWPEIEVSPTLPQHTSTAAQHTCENQTLPTTHLPRWAGQSVETLTPNQGWCPSQSQLYPNAPSDSSLWQNFDVWQDRRYQNGRGNGPLISPNGRFYSLFNNEVSSPFMDFQSLPTSTAASGHVTNTERPLGDDHLAGTCSAESNTGYDEWPSV